ncbi:MAG: hypothetical protein JWQ69_3386 [Pseudomonas sp.]|nr:hypothetical protein [Pseudomonas sp.]
MKRLVRSLAGLMLSAVLGMGLVQAAGNPSGINYRSTPNPTDGAIRRANPNSRQGTESTVPGSRGINTPNNPRPTLENGGIGNGYPTRQSPPSSPLPSPSNVPSRDSTR